MDVSGKLPTLKKKVIFSSVYKNKKIEIIYYIGPVHTSSNTHTWFSDGLYGQIYDSM